MNLALTLWNLGDQTRALQEMQTARDLKVAMGLSTMVEDLKLAEWRGETLPRETLQQLGGNTVVVLTDVPDKREEWKAALEKTKAELVEQGVERPIDLELIDALLALLAGEPAALPPGHAYADFLEEVVAAISDWESGQG